MLTTMEWTMSHTYSSDSGKPIFILCYPSHPNHHNNSFAFILYSFIVVLIDMYATTGRNAPSKTTKVDFIETITPGVEYGRVPSENHRMENYALGDDDDEEYELAPR